MITVSTSVPWDLRRRGAGDASRHEQRIKDAIKQNLHDILSHEDIITSDGVKRVRVRLRYLEQFRFKEGSPQQGTGQGPGQIGEELWRPGQPGLDDGDGAGDQPGEHTYEVEVDLEEVTRLMLEELQLPWLEQKPAAKILPSETYEFTDRRKRGILAHLDKRRTLRENLLRNAARGQPGVHDLADVDLRFRVPEVHQETATNAAVYLLMDDSGSMTTDKKLIAKGLAFWLVRFLRLKYARVEIVFIVHDIEAEIVNEHDFFGRSMGGGTKCSSAYAVALAHMTAHHPAALFNVYVWHFSDGDNFTEDNLVALDRMQDLLHVCTLCGYVDIQWTMDVSTTSALRSIFQRITHPRFIATVLRTTDDLQGALKAFLGADVGQRREKQ